MLSAETMITFFTASALLALAPGPDNIFVLTQSALRGKLAGIVVMTGLCTGLVFHTSAVALGIAVIFQKSALAFSMLKTIGACYLLYLAWQVLRASSEKIEARAASETSLSKLYIRGIIMNITNPKVSIFFLAFLPQFADPGRGPVSMQILLLGGIFILTTILVFGCIALMSGAIGDLLKRSDRAQKILNRVAGIVFIGLAIKLSTSER